MTATHSALDRSGAPAPWAERKAFAELLFATSLWAFGFIAGRWVLEGPGPLWGNAIRYLVATLASVPILWWLSPRWDDWREAWWQAMPAGLALSATLMLQLAGLRYTSVANSAFLTCLYVLFVPLLGPLFGAERTTLRSWGFAALALVGCYAMAAPQGGRWNVGDLLTVLSALGATCQIHFVQRIAPRVRSAFLFNTAQSLWAGLPAAVLAWVTSEPLRYPFPPIAWAGILSLALGATLVGFLIQLRVQRVLPVMLVSVVYLLESPIAAVMAYFIFRERLAPLQCGGAALIVVAAVLAIASSRSGR
jgi:drug/metabolite transporter (DMT)-like permease